MTVAAEDAPSAAREAVARAWEKILRERHPNVAWAVTATEQDAQLRLPGVDTQR